jgi:hypothetical protein
MSAPNTLFCKPASSRANSLSGLFLVVLCLGSLTQLATAETPRFLLDGVPRLGVSVKQFKHDFPAAHCRRRKSGEVDAHALKREWYRWIDCAVEKGVYVNGQPVILSVDDQLAVAMSASFQDQKLVSLNYMFGAECLDSLLRLFVLHFGPPDSPLRRLPTRSKYASWTHGNSRLEIEQLVIHARIDGSGALRIEKKSTTMGVRVRIAVSDPELSGELQEQDNPGDLALTH